MGLKGLLVGERKRNRGSEYFDLQDAAASDVDRDVTQGSADGDIGRILAATTDRNSRLSVPVIPDDSVPKAREDAVDRARLGLENRSDQDGRAKHELTICSC